MSNKRARGLNIGLHQAKRLCQLPQQERLDFIAEGLPIILDSAQGFWAASQKLEGLPREAKVLEGFAEEEAAKILILMDAVRCPSKLISSRLNRIIGWFYDHLARLIYADAVSWKPVDLAQLREYVDHHRREHYVEGYAGEYIMPNLAVYKRESSLYADVEAYQDDTLRWSEPRQSGLARSIFPSIFRSRTPGALRVVEAMQHLGLFSSKGLKVTSEIWGSRDFRESEDRHDGGALTEKLLTRLDEEKLILDTAEDRHVRTLYNEWQIPMYNLDFSIIPVPLEELQAEQESGYWAMVGDP